MRGRPGDTFGYTVILHRADDKRLHELAQPRRHCTAAGARGILACVTDDACSLSENPPHG